MDEPLLQTKLQVPLTRPDLAEGFVRRPRLITQLAASLSCKLTLIAAPAGFGKTTLVSYWLEHLDLPAAWLALDEHDSDLTRFLIYLITALQTLHPEVGANALAMLQSSLIPDSQTPLVLLINDLTAIGDDSILVLDDYHTIEAADIDQALTYFIDRMPPTVHVVMTSRADPNLPLARLRAKGQLRELRSADLRFTQAESGQFLEQMTGIKLDPAAVAALDRRTEGWIAGLHLAALSLRQRKPDTVLEFIDAFSGSHRYIMDYLVDEVLQQQSAEVQSFLLLTSILDRLSGPLCEALLQCSAAPHASHIGPTAQELLVYLEQIGLFITPLDDQRHWYRYHSLFADLLRYRLAQTYPEQVAPLHLCASDWYEQAGLIEAAVRHALAARAFDRAAVLVEEVAPLMIQHGAPATLLSWLNTLPDADVTARPLLTLYQSWGLFLSGRIKEAAGHLQDVETRLAEDETKRTPEVERFTTTLRAYLVRLTGDFGAAIALSQQTLQELPEEATLLRVAVTLNLAVAHYLQDQFEPASRLFTAIINTGQTVQLMSFTLFAIHVQAQLLHAQGALRRALRLCHDGLELVKRRGWHDFSAIGILYTTLGNLYRQQNELSVAADYLEKGIALGKEGNHPQILMSGHVWLALLRQAQGDEAGSHEALRAALQLVQYHEASRFLPMPPAACYQARLWIAQGNLAAARRWVQESALNLTEIPVAYNLEVEYLTLARLLIAEGELEAAESLLLRLQEAAVTAARHGSLIEILVLQAVAFAAQKRGEAARSALQEALRLAAPEGFVRVFLDEGAPIAALLRQAVAQDAHTAYALYLLDAFEEAHTASQPLGDPLSERELEVLRLVAAGYSNQEIAQDLVIAVSTTKKHINNIYGKLDVGSRTQAVARARELGLL